MEFGCVLTTILGASWHPSMAILVMFRVWFGHHSVLGNLVSELFGCGFSKRIRKLEIAVGEAGEKIYDWKNPSR